MFVSSLLLFSVLGLAQDPDDALSPEEQARVAAAEYYRLSEYMHDLAKREAWEGVADTYSKVTETGHELSFEDQLVGAHAASALGDIGTTRERLLAAHALQESREVIEWLWTIDTTYTKVELAVDPGTSLAVAVMPFNPHEAKVVAFAVSQIASQGAYAGYLPAGDYTLGDESFGVRAGVGPVLLDLRTEDGDRKRRSRSKR